MLIHALLLSSVLAGIQVEVDLSALMQRHADVARIKRTMRCGIKVPGHTIIATPGTSVLVRRRRYIVPDSAEISFVDLPDDGHVWVGARRVALANGEQDQFGFRRVDTRTRP